METAKLKVVLKESDNIKSRKSGFLFFIYLLAVILVAPGCVTLYKPNAVHSPMLQKKGDGHVSAAIGITGTGMMNLQAAYAVSNHVGLMTEGMYHYRSSNYTSGSNASIEKLNITGADLGIGYFEKLTPTSNKIIHIYGGAGFGKTSDRIKDTLNPDPEISADFRSVYFQPGITFTSKFINMAVDLRAKYIQLYHVNAYLYNEFEWWNTDYLYASDSTLDFVLFEPAFTVTAGGKNLNGLFQAGLVIPIINASTYYSSNSATFLAYPFFKFSIGVQYRFGRKQQLK